MRGQRVVGSNVRHTLVGCASSSGAPLIVVVIIVELDRAVSLLTVMVLGVLLLILLVNDTLLSVNLLIDILFSNAATSTTR